MPDCSFVCLSGIKNIVGQYVRNSFLFFYSFIMGPDGQSWIVPDILSAAFGGHLGPIYTKNLKEKLSG
jgi:hypothetical protein